MVVQNLIPPNLKSWHLSFLGSNSFSFISSDAISTLWWTSVTDHNYSRFYKSGFVLSDLHQWMGFCQEEQEESMLCKRNRTRYGSEMCLRNRVVNCNHSRKRWLTTPGQWPTRYREVDGLGKGARFLKNIFLNCHREPMGGSVIEIWSQYTGRTQRSCRWTGFRKWETSWLRCPTDTQGWHPVGQS